MPARSCARKPVSGASPDDAWLRLKDARTLRPNARGVAQRGGRMARTAGDAPRRARSVRCCPTWRSSASRSARRRRVKELSQARGVDDRHGTGLDRRRDPRRGEGGQGRRRRRRRRRRPTTSSAICGPRSRSISAWISQLARDESIDTALLATRADLVAFLRGDADARLANGWRAELLGDGIRSLIAGESGLHLRRAGSPATDSRSPDDGGAPATPIERPRRPCFPGPQRYNSTPMSAF